MSLFVQTPLTPSAIPGDTVFSASGTTVNWNNGLIQQFSLTANLTFTAFSNPVTGKAHVIEFTANASGPWTVTLPTGSNHYAAANPNTVNASSKLIASAIYDGTNYIWAFGANTLAL